jgi:MFS family permease
LQNEEAGLTGRHGALLVLLMACGFLVVGQLYITIPLVDGIAARFAVDPAEAALAGTAFGLAYAAGFLLFGPLSDRHGRKRMIVIGLAATGLATALVGMAGGFGVLLAARVAQGLAASIFPPAALALVTEELPPRHRPLGVSLMSFAFLGAAPPSCSSSRRSTRSARSASSSPPRRGGRRRCRRAGVRPACRAIPASPRRWRRP